MSLENLAKYLTTGFWQAWGELPFRFNVTSTGIGAKSGTITYNITGWTDDPDGLSAERKALTREVFKLYAAVLGINFQEVTGEGGDIRFTDNESGAYAYLVSGWLSGDPQSSVVADYSIVNVEADWFYGISSFDSYSLQTILHEVGHALGLGHQGLYNYTGTPLSYADSAQFANDSWQVSMMSYWDQYANYTTGASFSWLHTPMAVDWIALNDLYGSQVDAGKSFGVANAFPGDTIYGVGTNISAAVSKIWNEFKSYAGRDSYTIVDGGGYDTLNVSHFSASQLINLAPSRLGATAPSVSNIGGKIGNLTIAVGTIIEAAVGGDGNDRFVGNEADNAFWGGGGNDRFDDSPGSDVYYGQAGTDTLFFADSLNLFDLSLNGVFLCFKRRSGSLDLDRVAYGVENISFNKVVYGYQQLVATYGLSSLPTVVIQSANASLTSGALTNSSVLTFQGSLSKPLAVNQVIAFYRNDVQIGTASPSASGSTTWFFTTTEDPGTRTVLYKAQVVTINGGELGLDSSPFALNFDTEPPLVSLDPLQTYDTTPPLSGRVSDSDASVSVTISGITRAAVNEGDGRWQLQWDDLLEAGGPVDVLVTATDPAGNSQSEASSAKLHILADDFRADSSTAGLLEVGSSQPGILEYLGDHDWFAVDVKAKRIYTFRLNTGGLLNPRLSLCAADGSILASNDDVKPGEQLNSLITYTSKASGRVYLVAAASDEAGAGAYTISVEDVSPPEPFYFSLARSIAVPSPYVLGGLKVRNNDIISFDGTTFQIWLNGNASGLAGAVLSDFAIISDEEVVVAFRTAVTLSGIRFEPTDLARLTRTASGVTISPFFDGSDVGLTTSDEAIDAVTGLADGSLLISTRGSGQVPLSGGRLSFAPEDLLQFTPASLGGSTAGQWSLHADMSDVGLSTTRTKRNENIVAVDVTADGRLVMASQGNASVPGLMASQGDAFVFQPAALGSTTSGTFLSPPQFNGALFGLNTHALSGLEWAV